MEAASKRVRRRIWLPVLLLLGAIAAAVFFLRSAGTAVRGMDPSQSAAEPAAPFEPGRVPADPPGQTAVQPAALDAGPAHGERATAPSPAALMMRRTDDADRRLLSEIERNTQTAPPQAVHELLALRRSGASPEALQRFVDEHLGAPMLVRMAAQRWLRAIAEPAELTTLPGDPVPDSFGKGGGPRRVQPIEPRE